MGRLFGTDGVRGVVGETLTPELALRLGRAIGAYFGPGSRVLVGRDVRAGGEAILNALAAGLAFEGVKVFKAGLLPTPTLQYAIPRGGFDGGVMVTASHNPPEYNGVKVIAADGVEIPREDERVIEEYYFKGVGGRPVTWRDLVEDSKIHVTAIEDHIKGIMEQVDVDKIKRYRFRVVIDCANSVGSLVTPILVRRLGARPITLNCNLDPEFSGREPEPTVETLKVAAGLVKLAGASLGIGHDGDADRAILITDQGEVLWGDRTGTLLTAFASEVWPELPRRTYTGVSSSILVEDYLKPRGIDVVWTPVGSVTISRRILRDGGAISGFEENGGYMHTPHQVVRDGPMKTALALYMLAERGKSMSELARELPQYYPIKTKIRASREEALCAVEAVKRLYSGLRRIEIDGVKVFGEDFWVLVRPSGTEPVVRIMLEARSPERATQILNEVKQAIRGECGLEG